LTGGPIQGKVADNSFVGLLEGAPDAMVCVDRCGRIALANAQTERMFGYQRDELLGQPVEILVPEMARAAHRAHRDLYAADPEPRTMGSGMELSARRRDGSTFPTEISPPGARPSSPVSCWPSPAATSRGRGRCASTRSSRRSSSC